MSETPMNGARIILVGGDDAAARNLAAFLSGLDLEVERAAVLPAPEAIVRGGDGPAMVVLAAPEAGKDLGEAIRDLRASVPGLTVVVLSAAARSRTLVALVREGVIDQVSSPDNYASVYSALRGGLERARLLRENESSRKLLARLRIERSRNTRRAVDLEEIYDATLENLMTALDLRDVETFGHSQTVAKYSQVLAGILGIRDPNVLDNIRRGALLHDVGKIAIPDSILKKPGPLTDREWQKIRLHPALGYGLVREIKLVKEAGNIILRHHERYDGNGYPEGLRNEEIPIEARIFAVADALDAITSHRPYRRERDFAAARDEIRAHKGTQFDPVVVEAFGKLPLARWERIRFETTRLLPSVMEYHKLATRS